MRAVSSGPEWAGSRIGLLVMVALAGAIAYVDAVWWAFLLIYAAALLALLAATWSWWCARHLRLFREAPERAPSVGEQLVERFTLENDSGLPIRLVEVRDRSRLPGARSSRVMSLRARQILTWESTTRLSSRGSYELGPTELRVTDPVGLFPRRVCLPGSRTLVVYPAVVAIPALSLPGQPVRPDPNWATPAAGRAMAEVSRKPTSSPARRDPDRCRTLPPAADDLLILLDLRQGSLRGEGPDSSLEYAVTVTASMIQCAGRGGRAVGLVASDSQMRRIPTGRGELHNRTLMEYLSTARDDGTRPLSSWVGKDVASWSGRGGLVVITADPSSAWVEEVASASQPGNRALGIFIDPAGSSLLRASKIPAQWRLALDLWVVRHGDDLSRLDTLHGRAVV